MDNLGRDMERFFRAMVIVALFSGVGITLFAMWVIKHLNVEWR